MTFKGPSRDGSTWAAYLGTCRVGYVTVAGLWWTNLLRPEGGVAAGREPGDPAAARAALEAAARAWVAAAGLVAAPPPGVEGTVSVPSVPSKKGRVL